ncbi:MAG: ABC transporter ATP-binding protein [Candidatus Dormibacteria bacterium]
MPADATAIRATGLSKRFGELQALDGLELAVNGGEVFGFLGPNGSGKSTTIRLLLGFLRPSAGSAELLGLDVAHHRLAILRRTGYLPSHAAFDEVTTGERALDDLAALGHSESPRRAEICERIHLDTTTLRRKVRDYSKGTRQKLAIVQALQHNPDLIIMDEPTEGLDPLVQHSFYALLSVLREEGKTIFFSSHIISEVERVCDRVAIIRQGRLVTVEHISALVARRRRHVEIRFDGDAPDLSELPGRWVRSATGNAVTGRLAGSVRPLLARLAGLPVADLTIEPARLEDVFLEMYGDAPKGGQMDPPAGRP